MKRIHLIGLFVLLTSVIIVLVLWTSFDYAFSPFTAQKAVAMNDGWVCSWEGSKESVAMSLPGIVKGGRAGQYLHISNTLTLESFNNPCLFLRTSEQSIRVFLNNSLIYEYARENSDRSPGSMYHFINLPGSYAGGRIDIYLMSPLSQYTGIVNEIRIGSSVSNLIYAIDKSSLELVFSVTVIFLGLILLFFYFAMMFSGSRYANILYLGLFIVLSGIWMSTESRSIGLFIQNPKLISNIAYITMYLAPIAALVFIIKTYAPKRSSWLLFFIWAFGANFIVSSIFYLSLIAEYVNTVLFFHVLLAVCIIVVGIVSVQEIKSGNKNIRMFFVGLIALCFFTIIDIAKFYFSSMPWVSEYSFYQLGIIIFILVTIASLAQHIFITRDEQISNEILLSLAYTDGLTGLRNRTSFDERVSAINEALDSYSSLHMIIMDINGLKTVNDNFGHKEGDRLIIDGTKLISQTLGRLGELFRIGGDEFAIIITNVEPYFIHVEIESLNKMIASYNENQDTFQISIAYGLDTFSKGHDKDLQSVFVRADRSMYICKENQKSLQKK